MRDLQIRNEQLNSVARDMLTMRHFPIKIKINGVKNNVKNYLQFLIRLVQNGLK